MKIVWTIILLHLALNPDGSKGKATATNPAISLIREVCSSKRACTKKGGECMSKGDTCRGTSYKGRKWCKNHKGCKCCVPIDCASSKLTACTVLKGTCISNSDFCEGRIAHHKVFCKNPKTCKCCFPKEPSDCVTNVTTVATTPYVTEVPFACGQTDPQVKHDCSGTQTEVVGKNATWSTSSHAFKNGLAIGIRIFPEPGPHDVAVVVGPFKIRLDEVTCSDSQGCSWDFRRWIGQPGLNHWVGKRLPCLPKDEWMLLTITDLFNGSVDATLQVRDEFYSLTIPVTLPNTGVTISVNAANTNLHSEISLYCYDTSVTTVATTPYVTEVPFDCGQTNSQVGHDCSETQTEVIGKNTTWSTSSNHFTSGLTIGIRILPEPGPHDVAVTVDASGYSYGIFKIRLDEFTCSDSQGCLWEFRRWTHDNSRWIAKTIPCLPKDEWMLLTITDHYNGSVDATLQAREGFYSLTIPVSLPNNGVTIRADAGNTNLHSEISLDCSP